MGSRCTAERDSFRCANEADHSGYHLAYDGEHIDPARYWDDSNQRLADATNALTDAMRRLNNPDEPKDV